MAKRELNMAREAMLLRTNTLLWSRCLTSRRGSVEVSRVWCMPNSTMPSSPAPAQKGATAGGTGPTVPMTKAVMPPAKRQRPAQS